MKFFNRKVVVEPDSLDAVSKSRLLFFNPNSVWDFKSKSKNL